MTPSCTVRSTQWVKDCKALQNDVAKMQEWSRQWLLKFHPAKCKVMRLGTGHPDFTYTMQEDNGGQIELGQADSEKDLGVTCDQKLKFRQHIDTQVAKANRMVGLIRRSFVYLDKDTFSTLFKVIVRPHLEYMVTPSGLHPWRKIKIWLKGSREGPPNWFLDYTTWSIRRDLKLWVCQAWNTDGNVTTWLKYTNTCMACIKYPQTG